jgi:hypothetical protein
MVYLIRSTASQVEVTAALRHHWLKEAAAAHFPPITMPSDADVVPASLEPPLLDEEEAKSQKKGKKKAAPTSTKASEDSSGEKSTWESFFDWWVGDGTLTTKIRSDFLIREALFAATQAMVADNYAASGLASAAEMDTLQSYATSTLQVGVQIT